MVKKLSSCIKVVHTNILVHHFDAYVVQISPEIRWFLIISSGNNQNHKNFAKKSGGAWCHHHAVKVVQINMKCNFYSNNARKFNIMINMEILICNHHCDVCDAFAYLYNNQIQLRRFEIVLFLQVLNIYFLAPASKLLA